MTNVIILTETLPSAPHPERVPKQEKHAGFLDRQVAPVKSWKPRWYSFKILLPVKKFSFFQLVAFISCNPAHSGYVNAHDRTEPSDSL